MSWSDRATLEAKAAAKLSHPHILTVFELAEDEDEVYLVSSWCAARRSPNALPVEPSRP